MRSLPIFLFLVGSISVQARDVIPLQKSIPVTKPKGAKEGTAPSVDAKPTVASLGAFGSPRINEIVLKEMFGKELDTWFAKGLENDPVAVKMEKGFIEKIKKRFGFPFAEFSIIQYFEPERIALHITLDVVEKEDVSRRMPFYPPPTETMQDPGGILYKWAEYENAALDLVEAGKLQPNSEKCVALHCPFGHKNPKLKKYEKIFVEGVKKYAPAIVEVQKRDARADYRAAATFVLAYWKEGAKVVEAMVDRIKDPDPVVRNDALRVLGDIAEFHSDLPIPTGPILAALDFPKVSDRSKALFVAYMMALNSDHARAELMEKSVPLLITLMQCEQPDHRELAHAILRKISSKDFPDTDVKAWTAWYNGTQRDREISRKN